MPTQQIIEITLGFIAFLALAYLGLGVYLRNPKSHTNQLFLFLSALQTAHVITNYLSLHPPVNTPENQLFWIRMVVLIGAFAGPTVFLLVHTFPKDKITLKNPFLTGVITLAFVSGLIAISPLLFSGLIYNAGQAVPIPGIGAPLYVFDVAGMFLISFILLIYKYNRARGEDRIKLFYLLIGLVMTFTLIAVTTVIAVIIFKNSDLIFLAPIYPVILTAFIAYAIVKHRFLDIQPIIARAVSYALFVVLVAALYAMLMFLGTTLLLGEIKVSLQEFLVTVATTILIAFSFQPFYRGIRRFTDRVFFKGAYDPDELLAGLGKLMSGTLDLDMLTNELARRLAHEMRITKAAFLLIENHFIDEVRGVGYKVQSLMRPELENLIHQQLKERAGLLLLQDLEDGPTKELFRKHDIEVVFPIRVKNQDVSILVLGPKNAGDIYTNQDLQVLTLLSTEAGIAIQNAKSYTSLQKASEIKSRFISVVSHQLRTPLSSIRWTIDSIRRKMKNEGKLRDLLASAQQNTAFLSGQLDDILVALDIYDKKIMIEKKSCDLIKLVGAVIKELRPLSREKKIKIAEAIDHDAVKVAADCDKLQRVLKILIENAINYSAEGGFVKVSARIEKAGDQKRILVTVSDQGIGILDSEKDEIFAEFYRSENARRAISNGLGLGNFIARAIIRAHGGDLWFNSAGKNKGADFHFSLPSV